MSTEKCTAFCPNHHHDAAAKSPDAKFQRIILPVRQICNLLGDGVSASNIQAVGGRHLGYSDEGNQRAESLASVPFQVCQAECTVDLDIVRIQWWTHIIKGLHKNDFIMAAKTDQISS